MRCLCLFKTSASARVPLLLLLLLLLLLVSQEKLCIVTEYASNGNLHDYIQRSCRRKLPEDLVWKLFIQVRVTSHAYRHRWANLLGGK